MVLTDRQRYAGILTIVAVIILSVGSWFRPRSRQNSHLDANLNVSRAEIENLQQVVRRNNLRSLSTNFTDVGANTIDHLAFIQPWAVNATAINELGMVVPKALDAVPRQLYVHTGANVQILLPQLWVPGMPFLLGNIRGSTLVPARISDSTPSQGTWVIVVANGVFGQTLVSPGIYNGISQDDCGSQIRYRLLTTVPLNKNHVGGALFDLAGNLQGVVLSCDDGPAVIPTSEIQKAVAATNSDTGRVLARYGFRLIGSGTPEKPTVVVSTVWDDWPAGPIFNPGDELFSIDGQPISSLQQASSALLNPQLASHSVVHRRGNRTLTSTLAPIAGDVPATSLSALAIDDQLGIAVSRVSRGSSADRAGILRSDRILSINGRVATEASVERVFRQYQVAEQVQLVVQRPGRRVLLTVQP